MGTRAEEPGLVGSYGEMEEQNQKLESLQEPGPHDMTMGGQMKRLLWHGGSTYDAWFSAASNQVEHSIHNSSTRITATRVNLETTDSLLWPIGCNGVLMLLVWVCRWRKCY